MLQTFYKVGQAISIEFAPTKRKDILSHHSFDPPSNYSLQQDLDESNEK
jgi:hypothetical protein